MKYVIKPWTFEECKLEGMKYRNRTEFHDKACGAYHAARRNKWLNEIFTS